MVVYDENFEVIHRLYDPTKTTSTCHFQPDKLVFHNTTKYISQLHMNLWGKTVRMPDDFTLVVYIDGACRGNGTPAAKASYGVYFGPGSPYNTYGLIRSSKPQTSTRAEIEALCQALKVICDITDKDFRLNCIKIASDSSYLVDAMSRYVERWI